MKPWVGHITFWTCSRLYSNMSDQIRQLEQRISTLEADHVEFRDLHAKRYLYLKGTAVRPRPGESEWQMLFRIVFLGWEQWIPGPESCEFAAYHVVRSGFIVEFNRRTQGSLYHILLTQPSKAPGLVRAEPKLSVNQRKVRKLAIRLTSQGVLDSWSFDPVSWKHRVHLRGSGSKTFSDPKKLLAWATPKQGSQVN